MKTDLENGQHFHLHTTLPLPSRIHQIDGLQILRAVAVSLVAWAHAGLPLVGMGVPTPNFGIFGIDIFFVISGFIMSSIVLRTSSTPGAGTAWHFLQRRLLRIYPVYWIFAVLGLLRLQHSHMLHQNYLPAFFLVPLPQFPRIFDLSWTLMFEMFFYACLSATLLLTVRRSIHLAMIVFCATVAFGTVHAMHAPAAVIVCNPILLEFVLGALLAVAHLHFGTRRTTGRTLLVIGLILSCYLRAHPPATADSMQMILAGQRVLARVGTWGVAAAMIVAGMVFWSPAVSTRLGLLAVVMGNASYSAYLGSQLVEEFGLRLILRLHPSPPLNFGKEIAIQVTLVLMILGAGWVSYQFLEWPLVRALQRKTQAAAKHPPPLSLSKS